MPTLRMNCVKLPTEEDKQKKIYRIQITPENWEENEQILKSMGIKLLVPEYVELKFNLKKEKNK